MRRVDLRALYASPAAQLAKLSSIGSNTFTVHFSYRLGLQWGRNSMLHCILL
jgi:hypothetical protein